MACRRGTCVETMFLGGVCLFSCHGSSSVVVETGVAVASAAGVGETRDENGEDADSAVVARMDFSVGGDKTVEDWHGSSETVMVEELQTILY